VIWGNEGKSIIVTLSEQCGTERGRQTALESCLRKCKPIMTRAKVGAGVLGPLLFWGISRTLILLTPGSFKKVPLRNQIFPRVPLVE
jgi:hypothetical protein